MESTMPGLATLVPSPLRPFARRVRKVWRNWNRVAVDEPLVAENRRVLLELFRPNVVVERGDAFACPIRLTNRGSQPISSAGKYPITLRGRWLESRRRELAFPPETLTIPGTIWPGSSIVLEPRIASPKAVGEFFLEWEPHQANGPAFHECGTRPALVDVHVTGCSTSDIDYHKEYAHSDLTKDFWTVVGPPNQAEFNRLSSVKLDHLIDLGLKPNSRLLDVGCGTGLLTTAAEGFLSDVGAYFGTDIGAEAIEFCRKKFTRPNFKFAVNEMTKLPIPTGTQYDMAVFFSVFTHTFPDETALLLSETKRVLAPDGVIFADVFTSPLTQRCAGNRGAMELNREHFLRLVELIGLRADVVFDTAWQSHARREFFAFRHR
jgi:SAM-dependent methyltransferase